MALEERTLEIVRRLVAYLRDHPRAADGAEGIAVWWLGDYSLAHSEQLSAALSWMQQHRLIEQIRAVDGRVRYRRCPMVVDVEQALQAALEARA